jgi:hypothetical protein
MNACFDWLTGELPSLFAPFCSIIDEVFEMSKKIGKQADLGAAFAQSADVSLHAAKYVKQTNNLRM